MHVVTPFDVPEAAAVLDLETFAARDFTPERTADLNVYDKVADHLSDERRKERRTIIASYSVGARDRLAGLLRAHGVSSLPPAERLQDALAIASNDTGGPTALVVLPHDHGSASSAINLLSDRAIS